MSEPSSTNLENRPSPDSRATSVNPATAPRRPPKKGYDSLWERAKRTLGSNSLTFLQPETRSTVGNEGEIGSASGNGPTSSSKRRDQVRQAQRTHRQRTQNYIKSLELEVIRLRSSESSLIQQRDAFQAQVEILKATILRSNIPLPPGLKSPPKEPSQTITANSPETVSVSYRIDDSNHQRLHVDWNSPLSLKVPQKGQYQDYDDGKTSPSLSDVLDRSSQQQKSESYFCQTAQIPYGDTRTQKSKPLFSPEIAIEFVLALEHPCMKHIPHSAAAASDDPSNHMLMASTRLVSSAPQQPQPNMVWDWTASYSAIQELLNISSSINLDGEITPVEAWNQLHQHPGFERLDRQSIDNLKNELSGAVRCVEFGAVLNEDLFRQTINRHLARV